MRSLILLLCSFCSIAYGQEHIAGTSGGANIIISTEFIRYGVPEGNTTILVLERINNVVLDQDLDEVIDNSCNSLYSVTLSRASAGLPVNQEIAICANFVQKIQQNGSGSIILTKDPRLSFYVTNSISSLDTWITECSSGGSGGAPSGAASGDLTGAYPGPEVDGLRTRGISVTAPLSGQVYLWNTTTNLWTPGLPSPSGAAGGDLTGSYPNPQTDGIYGWPISPNDPNINEALVFNGTEWTPSALVSSDSTWRTQYNSFTGTNNLDSLLYRTGGVNIRARGNIPGSTTARDTVFSATADLDEGVGLYLFETGSARDGQIMYFGRLKAPTDSLTSYISHDSLGVFKLGQPSTAEGGRSINMDSLGTTFDIPRDDKFVFRLGSTRTVLSIGDSTYIPIGNTPTDTFFLVMTPNGNRYLTKSQLNLVAPMAQNWSNATLTANGDYTEDGDGHDLSITNYGTLAIDGAELSNFATGSISNTAVSSYNVLAGTISLTAGGQAAIVADTIIFNTDISTLGNEYIFSDTIKTDNGISALLGVDTTITGGKLRKITPTNLAALLSAAGAGANFFNGHRTANGSYTHEGAGFDVTLQNYDDFTINSATLSLYSDGNINLAGNVLSGAVDHSLVKLNPAAGGTLASTPYAFLPINPSIGDDGMYLRWDNGNNQLILDTPAGGGADNWGTQEVVTGATLTGDGTVGLPLDVATSGITATQIAPGAVATSEILDGTILTADISTGGVTTTNILDGTIVTADIATGGVATADILDGTILMADLGQNGATSNQVITWNGSAWLPSSFSTTLSIGSLQTSGNANGLSLSGTTLRAHRATTTTPGMVTVDTQSFAGQKTIISADTMQLKLKSHGDGLLGIDFYDIDNSITQARMSVRDGGGGIGEVEFRTLNSLSGGLTRTFMMNQDKFQFFPGTRTGTMEMASLTNETYVTNSTPGTLVATHTYQYISNGSNAVFTLPNSGSVTTGNVYKIMNMSANGIVITLNPGSGTTINGSGTGITFNLQYENVELHVVGADYRIFGLHN